MFLVLDLERVVMSIYGVNTVLSALQVIEASSFEFHLTGSRYFGTSTVESDWDFFVEDDNVAFDDKYIESLRKELHRNGFVFDFENYTGAKQLVEVWQRDNVHVQIVVSAKARQYVQEQLLPIFKLLKPDKQLAKRLWTLGMDLYIGGANGVRYHDVKGI